jgi:hypothetical protein
MVTRKDCLDELAKKSGRPRKEVEDALDEILDAAEGYQHDGLGPDEAYAKARDEKLAEIGERAARNRRAEILDMRKEIARHRFYAATKDAIAGLKAGRFLWRSGEVRQAGLGTQAAHLAVEAKLVGVNLPFQKNRASVDAQFVALRRLWVGGMAKDLEQAGLLKIFATRQLEDKWTDELFELNKKIGGNPGRTGDAQALQIAEVIQKWQRSSMAALNREGAWVRSYSGYITRSSHDADAIRAAGPEKWVADTMPLLDLKRTFGTTDRNRARDALRQMWTPMKDGNHFDYGRPIDEPLYPNTARQASDSRELHFKSGGDWRTYNDKYGVSNATHTVVTALETGARRTALMKEFGTRPREAFERDLAYIKATLQQESKRNTVRLGRLQDEQAATPTPERTAEIAKLEAEIASRKGAFLDFDKWAPHDGGGPLRNRFAQIDGSSKRPVNRTLANLTNNWMAVQRMAKLGRVALTHFASLPTKAMEARYWGIPFAERYRSLFRGLTQGLEGSARREALDATLVAFENRLGHMMAMYDVADAPAGFLAQWESTFFKLTGVSSVIDNQKGDAEAMFASHVGAKRGQAWAEIGHKEQRVLQGFGIGEAEWKALHGVAWSKIGERTYLTPSDALKLSDDQVRAYLKAAKSAELERREPSADDVAKGREDLALQLATAYSDRAGFAIPMPSARIRAMLFGKNFEPGTGINTALRLIYQFKVWPADMVVRGWGREMYGTIGDGRMDRVAGLAEFVVGSIVFGVASEGVRELIQGRDPVKELQEHPLGAILKGGQRSGAGSLLGDYLLGQFDRHGFSAVASLAGPTFAQIDTLMDLMHAGGETRQGIFSPAAMRQRGADAIKLAKDNTPFMNLWATSWATDALIWHRLQEWINPGYLARSERRQRDQQGIQHWVSPAKTDAWITGRAASPF